MNDDDDRNQSADDALQPDDTGMFDGDIDNKLEEDGDSPATPPSFGFATIDDTHPSTDDPVDPTEANDVGIEEATGVDLGHATTHEEELAEAEDLTEEY